MAKNNIIDIVKKARADERKKTIAFSVEAYSSAMTMVLCDKFDFTNDQLQKIATEIGDVFDSILRGYISIEDIKKTLHDEGVDILIEVKVE